MTAIFADGSALAESHTRNILVNLLLTLLHSERSKLYAILAFLNAVGLNQSSILTKPIKLGIPLNWADTVESSRSENIFAFCYKFI